MKINKMFILFVIMLVTTCLMLSGCATPEKPSGGSDKEEALTNQKVIKWTLATSWPSGLLLQKIPEQFAEEVKIASGGRLIIDVQPGGAIVGPLEVLDATNTRTIDAYHSTPTYWMGKAPAASLFTSVPMGFEPFMYLSWLYERGGWELWQKTYDEAGFNIKVIPLGITHPEMLAHSHKPLQKPEDFKGLKHRCAADFAQIFKKMGVSVVTVPGSEVYPSLERNVIDSAEFSTPAVNKQLGFEQITEYFSGPGMHQPACLFELSINKDAWNELPDDLKQVVLICAKSVTLSSWTKDFVASMEALDYFKSKGNTPVRVSDEVQRQFRDAAWAYLDQQATKDQMYNEVWSSMKDYWTEFIEYEDFMVPIRK